MNQGPIDKSIIQTLDLATPTQSPLLFSKFLLNQPNPDTKSSRSFLTKSLGNTFGLDLADSPSPKTPKSVNNNK